MTALFKRHSCRFLLLVFPTTIGSVILKILNDLKTNFFCRFGAMLFSKASVDPHCQGALFGADVGRGRRFKRRDCRGGSGNFQDPA